jgi:hypothetical protein
MADSLAFVGLATLFMGGVALWPSSDLDLEDRLVALSIFIPPWRPRSRSRADCSEPSSVTASCSDVAIGSTVTCSSECMSIAAEYQHRRTAAQIGQFRMKEIHVVLEDGWIRLQVPEKLLRADLRDALDDVRHRSRDSP